MSSTSTDYQLARKRVKEKQKFKKSLATYIIMSIFFVVTNLLTNPDHFWAIYPILGWGIGIASHYHKAYVAPRQEDQAMEEELRELQKRKRRLSAEGSREEDYLDLEERPPLKEKAPKKESKWNDGDLV